MPFPPFSLLCLGLWMEFTFPKYKNSINEIYPRHIYKSDMS